MKKTISFIAGLLLALTGMAQENKGGISGFMKEELEDFDNFFDSAVESMDGVTIMRTFQGKTYTELWEEFGDVPMNPETECIEVAWCGFPKGTHREDIWHWFEETFGVAVHDLMYS